MPEKVSVYTLESQVARLARQAKLERQVPVLKVSQLIARPAPPKKASRPLGLLKLSLSPEAIAESLRPLDEEEIKLWEGDDLTDALFHEGPD